MEDRERKRARDKARYERDRERIRALNRTWYEANKEKASTARKQRYERDRERELARQRAYDEANRERKRSRERADYRADPSKKRAYKEANRHIVRAHWRNREARKAGASGSHTTAEVEAMLEDQGGLCAYCEVPLDGTYHVDHMIPLSRGGSNGWENLAVVCVLCNLMKHAKTSEEYMERRLREAA